MELIAQPFIERFGDRNPNKGSAIFMKKKKKAHTNQLYLSLVYLGMAKHCLPSLGIFERVERYRDIFII